MRIPRVYLDTSVLGGRFEPKFAPWSNRLIEDFRTGRLIPVLSDLLASEVADAPEYVRDVHDRLLVIGEMVAETEASLALTEAYQRHAVLGPRYRNDMRHIAIASLAEIDVVASWNFKHIVRLDKIWLFNAVNVSLGYQAIAIRSPREVTSHGKQGDQGS